MNRLFRSLSVLEKKKSKPEHTLELFWGLSKRQTREVLRKFADLNIVRRELVKLIANNRNVSQFCGHLHDLVLEFRQEMEVDCLAYTSTKVVDVTIYLRGT